MRRALLELVGCALSIAAVGCGDPTCALDTECATGQQCDLTVGVCVEGAPRDAGAPANPDSGADAAMILDGGPADATASTDADLDAAADAGVEDAQAADAGTLDTGPSPRPDAGFLPVRLQFPPAAPVVTSTDTIIVRGVIDSVGTPRDVTVNGVPATSTDGFAHFSAQVALQPGPNPVVVAYDEDGQAQTWSAGQIAREDVLLLEPVDFDRSADEIFIVDAGLDRLIAVRIGAPGTRVVSGRGVGSGTSFSNPQSVVVTADGATAFVLDRSRDAVLRVDLASGDRAIFSGGSTGAGPTFRDPRRMALDEPGGRLFVVDSNLDALFSVDLMTAARTLIADDDTGTGQNLGTPQDLVYDRLRDRVLVVDSGVDRLLAIALDTGNRTVISGAGPTPSNPEGIDIAPDGSTALVVDAGTNTLLSVDLATGDRTVVASRTRGQGGWYQPRRVLWLDPTAALALDVARGGISRVDLTSGDRLSVFDVNTTDDLPFGAPWGVAVHPLDPTAPVLFSDNSFDRIVAWDPRTGVRSVLATTSPDGASLAAPYGMAYDLAHAEALFVDTSLDALVAVNVNDGSTRYVSNEVVAGGPVFASPRDVTIAPDGRIFVVDDANDALYEVDAVTGQRTVRGSDSTGTGVELEAPWAVAVAASTSSISVLVADTGTDVVMRVDLVTGVRTELPGASSSLTTPRGLAVSADGRTLYISDVTRRFVVAVDLGTGERTVLASDAVGRGPIFGSPVSLAVHPDGYLVLVDNQDAVIGIDLITLDRVYLSK